MPLMRLLTDECEQAALGSPFDPKRERRVRAIRVFRPRFVEEVLSKAHPVTPIIWFGPIIFYAWLRAIRGGLRSSAVGALLFCAGWLVWSLMEYALHRFLFHMDAGETESTKVRSFLVHGYHHLFPEDPMRLVAPPMMSWPLAVVVSSSYYLLFGPSHALQLFAGTCTGYIAYDWIHYYTHHFRPRWGLGKWLRAYHMLHHFDDHDSRYGISSPLWDWVFGTYRPLGSRAGRAQEALAGDRDP